MPTDRALRHSCSRYIRALEGPGRLRLSFPRRAPPGLGFAKKTSLQGVPVRGVEGGGGKGREYRNTVSCPSFKLPSQRTTIQ